MPGVDLTGHTIVRCEQYSTRLDGFLVLHLDDGRTVRMSGWKSLTVMQEAS